MEHSVPAVGYEIAVLRIPVVVKIPDALVARVPIGETVTSLRSVATITLNEQR